jgi:hypothetical protein
MGLAITCGSNSDRGTSAISRSGDISTDDEVLAGDLRAADSGSGSGIDVFKPRVSIVGGRIGSGSGIRSQASDST